MGFRNSITSITIAGPVELAAGGVVAVSSVASAISLAGGTTVGLAGGTSVGISGNVPVVNPLAGTPLTVADAVDVLDSQNRAVPAWPTANLYTCALTAQAPYRGIMVQPFSTASPNNEPSVIAVQVANTTRGIISGWQIFRHEFAPTVITGISEFTGNGPLFFPVPADFGDTIKYVVAGIAGSWAGPPTGSFQVVGLAELPADAPVLRPDGRLPATGSRGAAAATTAASAAIVAAPGAGLRILVKAADLQSGIASGTGGSSDIQGTINGTVVNLISFLMPANGVLAGRTVDYGVGLLLDANTALNLVTSTLVNAATASVAYDIVV